MSRMEQLRNINRVEVRPTLKNEVLERIEQQRSDDSAPAYLKWVTAAALIINMIAVVQYIRQNNSSEESYQLFSTETTINY